MPFRAPETVPIPPVSVPTYVFGSHQEPLFDKPIILDPERPDDRFLTLSSYRYWSQCLAVGLRKHGLKVGDRVLFLSSNSIAFPIVYMGVLMAGGIFTGSSPNIPAEQLLARAKHLEPTCILASPEIFTTATEIAAAIGLGNDNVFLFERECLFDDNNSSTPTHPCQHHWKQLLDPTGPSYDWSQFITSPDQLAAINYSSGSTGLPKGVMVSHGNIVANATQFIEQQKHDPTSPEQGNLVNMVMWIPFFYVIGQNQYCVILPKRGIRNYIMKDFDLDQLLMYTARYRPVAMLLVPSLLIALISSPLRTKYDLSSVRDVLVGGAPLRQSVSDRFETLMPNKDCKVAQGWGMTELTLIAINQPPNDRFRDSSAGELLPNIEAKLMTPDGTTELIEPRKPGEIWIRGPTVAKGYWRRPDLTLEAFLLDGWFRTGDFGFFNERHHWYVVDRIQDVIYSPAEPDNYILPTDLESLLLDVPGVLDAGVTPIDLPDKLGRAPRAFVVLDPNTTLKSVEMTFNSTVQLHQRLVGGLFALEKIPRLVNNKVNRLALREIQI